MQIILQTDQLIAHYKDVMRFEDSVNLNIFFQLFFFLVTRVKSYYYLKVCVCVCLEKMRQLGLSDPHAIN